MWWRISRWVKRFLLWSLVLALLSIAIALIALHTDWGRERIKRIAEEQLASSFPGGARIGRIEGSVLGELVARDVELKAADGSLYAKIGELRLELALWPLLGKTAEIERLVADDVELYPLRTIAPPDPDDEPAAWSVELPEIEVHRARIVIESAPRTITLEGVDLTARAAMPAGAPITASAKLRGTWRERAVPFEGSVEAIVDGATVTLPRLDARIGGVSIGGKELAVDPDRPAGELTVHAPATAVRRLLAEDVLPADARLEVTAVRGPDGEVRIKLTGGVGSSRLTGDLVANLAAPRLRGVVTAKDVALGEATRGAHAGTGAAIVAFVADRGRIRGTAIATGAVDEYPGGDAVISFDAALDRDGALARAAGLVLAARADGTSLRAFGGVSRRDGALAIDTGRVFAQSPALSAVAGKLAPLRRGRLAVEAALEGTAEPLAVKVAGTLAGGGVEYGEDPASSLGVQELRAGFTGGATGSLAKATGEVTGWIRGVASGGVPRGDATFRASLRSDRTIAASVTARPAAAPEVVVSADAVISPGETTRIALGDHAIRMAGGDQWKGRGGLVAIGPERVTVERLRTTNRDGHVDVRATYEPATERLAVELDASGVATASIDPAFRGVASGKIRLAQRGARWDGTIELDGRGLAFAPGTAPVDAGLRVDVDGRRVTVKSTARTAALGGVSFDLDVDGPEDFTDVDGWRLLPRAAVRSAQLGMDRANLTAAGVSTGGVVHGTLYIAGADTRGTMEVRGVRTVAGDVEGDITFRAEDQSLLGATSRVTVSGLGVADVSARIAFPRYPFDPEAWQQLGRRALAHLGASFTDIKLDRDRLARFGVDVPYRGLADIAIAITDGGASATVDATIGGVAGGPIKEPIDVEVSAKVDAKSGTRVGGTIHDTRAPERTLLASFEGRIPSYDVDRWIADPAQARHAVIAGGLVAVPGKGSLHAPALLAVFGRGDLAKGTIDGKVTLGGTLGSPTAHAKLALAGLELAHRVPGRAAPEPTDLTIDARWGGATGRVTIDGKSGGGTVTAYAEGDPVDRATIFGSITASRFDLAPLAAFLPGDWSALEGKLGGYVTVRGLDSLARLRGKLAVAQAAVPLHPMLGKLRDGKIDVSIDDVGVEAKVLGALGMGTVSFTARSPGHQLSTVKLNGRVDDVSPLAEWEPVIDATIDADFERRAADRWNGKITISRASADLPPSGSDLGDPDKPFDLLFVEDGEEAPLRSGLDGRGSDWYWLTADIDLLPMDVTAEDLFQTSGKISAKNLRLQVGKDIRLYGTVDIERGSVLGNLFGRRYEASGRVAFNGSIANEPQLDITLHTRLRTLVLVLKLAGTPSAPEKQLLTEDSATAYTQDQLWGFLLGGEPGGDPSAQTKEAATGAGAAFVQSNWIGPWLKKQLPIKLDRIGCDPGNSVTAGSCTVGRWFGRVFVAAKRRFEAQKNENANEIQGQIYLRRDLYLEMSGGDAGAGGVDLLWRRRW